MSYNAGAMYPASGGRAALATGPQSWAGSGPGGGAYGDLWTAVLGPNAPGDGPGPSQGWKSMYDMPTAYQYKNTVMPDIIMGLVKTQASWTYTVAFPMTYSDEIKIAYSVFEFNQPLAEVVPHQTPSRVLKSTRSSRSAASIRRGLALEFEQGYLTTAEGATLLVRQLLQMKYCIMKTIEVEVMARIATANDNPQQWEKKWGWRRNSLKDRIDAEIVQYAEFIKAFNGIEQCDARLYAMAAELGYEPNMYVVGQELKAIADDMHQERMFYMYAGQRGVTRWMEGPRGLGAIRNTLAYQVPIQDAYSNTDHYPLLEKAITIGHRFDMFDTFRESPNQRARTADDRAIMIYSEPLDEEVKITMIEALRFAGRFDIDGELHPDHKKLLMNEDAEDMFIYEEDTTGDKKLCYYWGQLDHAYLDGVAMRNVVQSGSATLTEKERQDAAYLFDLYQELRNTPINWDGTADELGLRACILDVATSAVQIKDYIKAVALEFVRDRTFAAGVLASFVGVEAVGKAGDERAAAGVAAFRKLTSSLSADLGGEHNAVLDPGHVPHYFAQFVDRNNWAACTLFERILATDVVPLAHMPVVRAGAFPPLQGEGAQASAQTLAEKFRVEDRHIRLAQEHHIDNVQHIFNVFRVIQSHAFGESVALNETIHAVRAPILFLMTLRALPDEPQTALIRDCTNELARAFPGVDLQDVAAHVEGMSYAEMGVLQPLLDVLNAAAGVAARTSFSVSQFMDAPSNPVEVNTAVNLAFGTLPLVVSEAHIAALGGRSSYGGGVFVGNPETLFTTAVQVGSIGPELWEHTVHRMPSHQWKKAAEHMEVESHQAAPSKTRAGYIKRTGVRSASASVASKRARGSGIVNPLLDAAGLDAAGTAAVFMQCGAFVDRWNAMLGMPDGVDRAVAGAFLFARVNQDTCEDMARSDKFIKPFTFTIWCPNDTHIM